MILQVDLACFLVHVRSQVLLSQDCTGLSTQVANVLWVFIFRKLNIVELTNHSANVIASIRWIAHKKPLGQDVRLAANRKAATPLRFVSDKPVAPS